MFTIPRPAPAAPDHEWLNSDELLKAFRRRGLPCSRRTLHRWINEGMPSHQPGGERGRRVFLWVEVERWVRSRCFADAPGRGTPWHTPAHPTGADSRNRQGREGAAA